MGEDDRSGGASESTGGEALRGASGGDRARLHVYFSGRVQGVGFRYTARALAHRHGVSGFVRNLTDGRVELEVEGPREGVETYLRELGQEFRHYVRDQEARWLPATGCSEGFNVRF